MEECNNDRTQRLDRLSVTTIRTLCIDAVERAGSGHPGMPMGAAPMAYVLFARHLQHHPECADWFNRDRFVLSAGHGSILLYSLLHLFGYGLELDDLKQFRQWGSLTPGHPEYRHTPGVEATTGPLGQGLGMAVGMAMAEAYLSALINREDHRIVDHFTYVICGDGDLMEGVSYEAASLAGHLQLGKLIILYDSNNISLDGDLQMSFSENVGLRFEAQGWQVIRVNDGNDLEAIDRAISCAKSDTSRPSLIEVKTVIGYGSPNKAGVGGENGTHGKPLGELEVKLTKQMYGWPADKHFYVPEEVREHFNGMKEKGKEAYSKWMERINLFKKQHPEAAVLLQQAMNDQLPADWDEQLSHYSAGSMETRAASSHAIRAVSAKAPLFLGGSADLAGSNKTYVPAKGDFGAHDRRSGKNIWFGVREFAMGCALNGMTLHGGLRVYGGTFLVFSDYLRPAIRLSALMKLPVIYIFTHDSIAVGEDGPTHQPIEQLSALRAIPGLTVFRPADANETTEVWRYVLSNRTGPYAVILTRQAVHVLSQTSGKSGMAVHRGGYVVSDAPEGEPELIMVATGSEVQLALSVQQELLRDNIPARVVSMPSRELFAEQPEAYRNAVLPPHIKARIVLEMASPVGWEGYAGDHGAVLGIHRFGSCGSGERLIREFGFTVEQVAAKAKSLMGRRE
jgi:transketolase